MAGSLYQQVIEYIRAGLESGEYRVGERIPTENELARILEVSRPTVRQALAKLETEGLLTRVKGSGTFVSQPKMLHESTSFLSSYREESEKKHLVLHTEVLELCVQCAGPETAEKLNLPKNANVTKLVRRRWLEKFNDGKPVVYTVVYVPYALYPEMKEEDFTTASLYDLLDKRGMGVRHASRILDVQPSSPELAAVLEISGFEPLIHVESVGVCGSGRRIEYAHSYYPVGCSRFLIEVDRPCFGGRE